MDSLQFVLYGVIFICLWCVFNQYLKDHPNTHISAEGYQNNKNTPKRRNNNHSSKQNNKQVPKPPKPPSNIISKAFGIANDVSDTMHDTVGTLLKKVQDQLDGNKPTQKSQGKKVDIQETMESFLMGNKADYIHSLEEQKRLRNEQGQVNRAMDLSSTDLDSFLGTTKSQNALVSML
jgi:hypothetical protein